ncbi:molybdopterin-synthase adenylyltransferase MoeB [Teredinibacter purpureus]|uniref:molybdopterin-synthase adenylyltransferase MoeB n=1 Tax=Teredinibacter purpureus TaxID=2731756 RepID=UPI0005F8521F|nr:molybdopterin-synthase adenylyltransferase MoeB [Teredinibacter purpureus]
MKLPPLVEPLAELSSEEIARYSRHLLIPEFGITGQKRLKNSKVLVIGAGGLGSPALLYLAAAGVGTIGIVEFDTVEESNLQRQVIHRVEDVGEPKVESAAKSIRQLNPYIQLTLYPQRLDAENVCLIFSGYDLIVDGTDNFSTRYLVNDASVLTGKPYIWGSIFRFEGQASVFWENAPDGLGRNYRDLYPEPPPPEFAPSCSEGGVLGVLCASIGSIMATEAIKLITGVGESLLGRLMVYDALDMTYRTLPLGKDPNRTPITTLVDYDYFCGLQHVTEDNRLPTSIHPKDLKKLRDTGEKFHLIDVREETEWNIAHISGALHIPKNAVVNGGLPENITKDSPIILHCKSGVRSRDVFYSLQKRGFSNVKHLEGGIISWIKEIDPSLPLY